MTRVDANRSLSRRSSSYAFARFISPMGNSIGGDKANQIHRNQQWQKSRMLQIKSYRAMI
jgi:hypothetical protein